MAAGGGGDDLANNLQGLSLKGNGDVAGKVLDDKFELTKLNAGDDGALYCIHLDKDTVSKDPKQLDGHHLLPRGFWGSEFKVSHPHPNDKLVISQSFMKIMGSLSAPIGRCLPYLQKWKADSGRKEELEKPIEKPKEVKSVCIKDTWKWGSQSESVAEKEGHPAVLQDEETSCGCKLCQYRNFLIREKKHKKE